MREINKYSLQDIYQMINDDNITLSELANYISNVIPNMEMNEEVKKFLERANQYVNQKITEKVNDNDRVMNSPQGNDLTPPSMDEDNNKSIETDEMEMVTDQNYPFFPSDDNYLEEARESMEQTYNYCLDSGMSIDDISLSGKGGKGPYISFEINNESKQFLDHLMNEFYEKNDVALEFSRNSSNGDEFFTIEIDSDDMSKEKLYNHVKEVFDEISKTVATTRRDYEYERTMPDGLKNIKDHFNNDDPDISGDFTIGYVRNGDRDTYYIVADDEQNAIEYARSIGYDIKSRQGSNIFEVATDNSVIDTKLDKAAVDLSLDKEAIAAQENGLTDLDINGTLNIDYQVDTINNFIETSNDPNTMCLIAIEIPRENDEQRIVKLNSSKGDNDVIIFQDGNDFDQKILPEIIDKYLENNQIDESAIIINDDEQSQTKSCQVESENNTGLFIDGYDDEQINAIKNEIQEKQSEKKSSNEYENSRQKTIGTYQSSDKKTSAFVSMPVLFVICILFILMVSLLIFAR